MSRRVLGAIIVALFGATCVGWMLGAVLMVRMLAIQQSLELLQLRMRRVAPVDVLCGISRQIQVLHGAIADHCETVHGLTVPPYELPAVCRDRAPG